MRVNKSENEVLIRIMTAFMLGPLMIGAIIYSTILWQAILLIIAAGMLYEWYNMTSARKNMLLLGLIIIPVPITSLFSITLLLDDYIYEFITYFGIIWSMDTFAMMGGKYFGGPKLIPTISPQKTYTGLIAGLAGCISISHLISYLPNYDFVYQGWGLVLFTIFLGIFGQISDVFISFFKRKFNLKDTGNILPGHGGLLDRFDSLIFTAPIILYVVL